MSVTQLYIESIYKSIGGGCSWLAAVKQIFSNRIAAKQSFTLNNSLNML
jgi:hypothetical protein